MIKENREVNHASLGLKFQNIKPIENTGFVRGECLVAYGGKNRNYSNISKEAFENAEPTVFGIPVVGNWIEDNTEEFGGRFGGHDIILEKKGNDIVIKDTTIPFGFVPQDANPRWTSVEDDNGNSKSYYTVDVILWAERYPNQIQSIIENGANQSMEIMLEDYDWDEDYEYLNVHSFYYSALCILGKDEEDSSKNVEPCFEESSITIKNFKYGDSFESKVFELKTAFEGGGDGMKEDKDIAIEKEDETFTEDDVLEDEKQNDSEEDFENKEELKDEDAKDQEHSYKEEFLSLSEKYKALEAEILELKDEVEELREYRLNIESQIEEDKKEELIESYSLLLTKEEIESCLNEEMSFSEVEIALSKMYATKSLEEAKKANSKKEQFKLPNREGGSVDTVKKNKYAL